jgi:hypothetical protein
MRARKSVSELFRLERAASGTKLGQRISGERRRATGRAHALPGSPIGSAEEVNPPEMPTQPLCVIVCFFGDSRFAMMEALSAPVAVLAAISSMHRAVPRAAVFLLFAISACLEGDNYTKILSPSSIFPLLTRVCRSSQVWWALWRPMSPSGWPLWPPSLCTSGATS